LRDRDGRHGHARCLEMISSGVNDKAGVMSA